MGIHKPVEATRLYRSESQSMLNLQASLDLCIHKIFIRILQTGAKRPYFHEIEQEFCFAKIPDFGCLVITLMLHTTFLTEYYSLYKILFLDVE